MHPLLSSTMALTPLISKLGVHLTALVVTVPAFTLVALTIALAALGFGFIPIRTFDGARICVCPLQLECNGTPLVTTSNNYIIVFVY